MCAPRGLQTSEIPSLTWTEKRLLLDAESVGCASMRALLRGSPGAGRGWWKANTCFCWNSCGTFDALAASRRVHSCAALRSVQPAGVASPIRLRHVVDLVWHHPSDSATCRIQCGITKQTPPHGGSSVASPSRLRHVSDRPGHRARKAAAWTNGTPRESRAPPLKNSRSQSPLWLY